MLGFLRNPSGLNTRPILNMTTEMKPSHESTCKAWEDLHDDVINQYCAEAVLFWGEQRVGRGLMGQPESWLIDSDGKRTYLKEFWKPCINPSQAKEVLAEIGWMLQSDHSATGFEIHGRMGTLGTAIALADLDPKLALVVALTRILETPVPVQEIKELMHA